MLALLLAGIGCCVSPGRSPGPRKTSPRDWLTDEQYKKVVVEVTWFETCEPDPSALAFLAVRILQHCHKESVTVLIQHPLRWRPKHPESGNYVWIWDFEATNSAWSDPGLKALADASQMQRKGDGTLVLHVLYVPGIFPTDVCRIGVCFDYDTVVVFKHRISGKVERAVLLHELGHALGLVNRGTPSTGPDHDDKDHPAHSDDPTSVMFWTVGSDLGLEPDFDEPCVRDLRANGGR